MDEENKRLLKLGTSLFLKSNPVTAPYALILGSLANTAVNHLTDDEPSEKEREAALKALVRELLEENYKLKQRLGEIDAN